MEQLDDKCELISKKLDQNSNANMIMARNNVLVPGKYIHTFDSLVVIDIKDMIT